MNSTRNHLGRRLWRWLRLLTLLTLLLGFATLALLLETTALVPPRPAPSIDDALRSRALALRVLNGLETRQPTLTLSSSPAEWNSLLILAGRGLPRVAGRVELHPQAALISASLRLPPAFFPLFLNLQFNILPSQNGLRIGQVRLGRLECSGPLALTLTRIALNLGLGRGEGSAVLDSLQQVELDQNRIRLHLREPARLKQRLSRLPARLAWLRELAPSFGSPWPPETLRLYSARLQAITAQQRGGSPPRLSSYLSSLFQLVRQRSGSGDPVQENQAALLALASYLGDWRFALLLGSTTPQAAPKTPAPEQVLLAGRDDLRRHFVISAGLRLLTDQGLTSAIGELKELLDAGDGGSGFSFIDLAADRAGSTLARSASDPTQARRLQLVLAQSSDESIFFPSLQGLPENLSQAEFEARFGSVDSPAYLQLVELIDRRLADCPVHRR